MESYSSAKSDQFTTNSLNEIYKILESILTQLNEVLDKDISSNFEIEYVNKKSVRIVINDFKSLLHESLSEEEFVKIIIEIINQYSLYDAYEKELSTIGTTKRIKVEEKLIFMDKESDPNRIEELINFKKQRVSAIREYMNQQRANNKEEKSEEEKGIDELIRQKTMEIKNMLSVGKNIKKEGDKIIIPIEEFLLERYKENNYPYPINIFIKKEGESKTKNIQKLLILMDIENFEETKKQFESLVNSVTEESLSKFKKVILVGKYTAIIHRKDLMERYSKDFVLKINTYFKDFYERCKKVTEVELSIQQILLPLTKLFGIKPALLNYFIYYGDDNNNKVYEKGEIKENFEEMISKINFTEDANNLFNGEYYLVSDSGADVIEEFRNILKDANYMVGCQSLDCLKILKIDTFSNKLYVNEIKNLKGKYSLLSNDYAKYKEMEKMIKENIHDCNLEVKEIKTFDIKLPGGEIKCEACKKAIPDNQPLYYCNICKLFFCCECTENKFKNRGEISFDLYIHPEHNLIYFYTRDENKLKDIDIKRLGNNLHYAELLKEMEGVGNPNALKHAGMCNACGVNLEDTPRYLCLKCRPGAEIEGGYFDYCYNCIKKYREQENPPNDKDEPEKLEPFCFNGIIKFKPEHIHKEHPLLFIISGYKDYYHY